MKQLKIMMFSKRKIKRNLILITTSSIGIYLLISLYFFNHFFFHTEINGIDVSLRAHDDSSEIISDFINNYRLQLIERNGVTEVITSQDIKMQFNKTGLTSRLNHIQKPFLWMGSLWKDKRYYIKDLYNFNQTLLKNSINRLGCLNGTIIEPHNVEFKFIDGSYKIIKEIDGNKINKIHLAKAIHKYLSEGRQRLDLEIMQCYEAPKYTTGSKKTLSTQNQLNRYVSSKITYQFGNETEQLDGTTIHQWLRVDEDLDITISKADVAKYMNAMSKKYDTVGIIRDFQTSTGKKVQLQGGLYGWKIDPGAETEALVRHIQHADVIVKEPIYLQKAFSREGNEIGNTYIEINISRQHLWFYKDGALIVQGPVVTGNPNRGNATVLGVYMVNYKQKDATLTGQNYEAKVTYWMPFFGNMGLHDASWRHRFGREIYLTRGSHGCVNAPFYLAKTVFDNIDEGTPVVIYKE